MYRLDTRNWDHLFRASVYQANQTGSELQIISAARNTHVLAAQPKSLGSELYHLSWNPSSLLGTLLPYLLLCSEHCILLCSAQNPASLPDSVLCFKLQRSRVPSRALKEAEFRAENRRKQCSEHRSRQRSNVPSRAQKQARKQSSEQGRRVPRKMVRLGKWGFELCSQYMCVPSCRDNCKLRTCLVCLVN